PGPASRSAPTQPKRGIARGSRRPARGSAGCTRSATAVPPCGNEPGTTPGSAPAGRGPSSTPGPGRARALVLGPSRLPFRSCSCPGLRGTARQAGQDLLEPSQGTDVALGGGRLAQLQDAGALGIGELLEVPQRQHFAVDGVHAVEGGFEPELPLGADGG